MRKKYYHAATPETMEKIIADGVVKRGWVLLHNPQQGIAIPTRDITREYTKAQKEFLYDYYMERDCKEEANAIWQDE